MSKKIMKRSLALGALMAFAITGSVMAADIDETINGGSWTKFPASGTAVGYENVSLTNNSGGIFFNKNIQIQATEKISLTANGAHVLSYGNYDFSAPEIIITGNGKSDGLYIPGDTSGKINIHDFDTLTIDVDDWYAIFNNASKANTDALTITGNEGSKINLYSEGGFALGNGNYGATKIEGGTLNVISNSKKWSAIYSYSAASSIIDVNNLYVENTNSEFAGNTVDLSVGETTINVSGEAVVKGVTSVSDGGTLNLNVTGKDASFTGQIVVDNTVVASLADDTKAVQPAKANITLNNSTWNVTGQSNVTKLEGTNANINVNEVKEGFVTIDEVDEETEITVTTSSDNFEGSIENAMDTLAKTVIKDGESVADKLVGTAGSIYDEVTADVENGNVTNVDKTVAAANVSVNDMAAIGLMSWRAEMNDMNKRMGELRNANGEHGVWVRMVRGESEYNSVKNQYNQYQLGYDEKLSVDPSWTVGVALSYTEADNNFAQGNGESTNKALSLYGSKLNDDGTFVDLIAKYARLENEFTTVSGMGDAEYDANGYSVSAEFGKRIQQGKGLWIEPQVELTYGKVGSANYVTKNGVNVAQDSMDSIIGRVGFSLGKDIKDGNVYARASYLYDFDGETKANLNGIETLENDLGGGWWEVGVGANINLSEATYIYADIEKTFGGEVDTNWQWNLGVRYSF